MSQVHVSKTSCTSPYIRWDTLWDKPLLFRWACSSGRVVMRTILNQFHSLMKESLRLESILLSCEHGRKQQDLALCFGLQKWIHSLNGRSLFPKYSWGVILLMVQKSGKLTSWGKSSLSHHLQGFLYIPGDCLGFLNHQYHREYVGRVALREYPTVAVCSLKKHPQFALF